MRVVIRQPDFLPYLGYFDRLLDCDLFIALDDVQFQKGGWNHRDKIKTPRNFGIDPSGAYLLVANQDSDSIVVFRIDAATGELHPTGIVVDVPMPVCVKMTPRTR